MHPVWPVGGSRPVPTEVAADDEDVATDMHEAAAVLPVSPKASAALARRALQHILVRKAGVDPKASLAAQIDQVLDNLPADIRSNIDLIRNFGNVAAHPIESEGTILDVEPGEAAFTLDVLWDVADLYYVRRARSAAIREKLDASLKSAGKPPTKGA